MEGVTNSWDNRVCAESDLLLLPRLHHHHHHLPPPRLSLPLHHSFLTTHTFITVFHYLHSHSLMNPIRKFQCVCVCVRYTGVPQAPQMKPIFFFSTGFVNDQRRTGMNTRFGSVPVCVCVCVCVHLNSVQGISNHCASLSNTVITQHMSGKRQAIKNVFHH